MPVSTPIPIAPDTSRRPLLHILSTSFLAGDEVLVNFSDGSSAVYEAEELEKLRPTPKRVISAATPIDKSRFADVA